MRKIKTTCFTTRRNSPGNNILVSIPSEEQFRKRRDFDSWNTCANLQIAVRIAIRFSRHKSSPLRHNLFNWNKNRSIFHATISKSRKRQRVQTHKLSEFYTCFRIRHHKTKKNRLAACEIRRCRVRNTMKMFVTFRVTKTNFYFHSYSSLI
ncbi:Uncharacterised protein [Chlamydia trachomatis]|nr:Uncharacterised protein [Chlamydia trachomatis]